MRRFAPAFAATAAGVAYALLYPPFELTALSFVALAPLYVALRGCRPLAAAGLAGWFMFVATAGIVCWLPATAARHFGESWPAAIALWLAIGPLCTSPYYAAALGAALPVLGRLAPVLRPFAFAAALVTAELARSELGLRSPWALLGDAQASGRWLSQLASLGGVYAISFVVALANGAIGEAFVSWRSLAPRARTALLGAPAAVLALSLAYGAWRAALPVSSAAAGEIAVIQANLDPKLLWQRASARTVFAGHARLTREALRGSRDGSLALVIWPESAIQVGVDDPTYGELLRRMSKRVPFLVGSPRWEATGSGWRTYNSASLLHGAAPALHYDKRRLLPFSETSPFGDVFALGAGGDLEPDSFAAGRSPAVFEIGGHRAGVLICMEALYPSLGRELVGLGASVIVTLSNDGWFRGRGAPRQHFEQVRLRAIETGLPVVRATTTGISAVIAPNGAIVASLGEGEQGVLRARVPAAFPPTPYARFGDWLAGACAAAWLGLAGLSFSARLTREARPESLDSDRARA